MKDPIESFKRLLSASISSASGLDQDYISVKLEITRDPKFGDLAFPCFELSKLWKKSPNSCAEKLLGEISLPPQIARAEVVGAFLNFFFSKRAFAEEVLANVKTDKSTDEPLSAEEARRIVIDYSSPNIAKPFHVGHLRTTLIGNCLDKVYRHLRYKVTSINHLGDWGTQFGFVWAGCKLWGKPEAATVSALVDLYRKATALKEKQEVDPSLITSPESDINSIARSYFVDLENGADYAVTFWQWCLDLSLKYFKETYEKLGVHFDYYTGESFYSSHLDSVKQSLEKAGILQRSKDAWGVDLGEELGFARILTPDGRSLYLTRDIACAEYRNATFKFDKALYVVGAPQELHFRQLKAILKLLGRDYADKIEHVSFGHVKGMKTRGEGGAIELNDLLDEAKERALDAYKTQVAKRPEDLDEEVVATAVALGAIVFSNLSRSRLKEVTFSWEHALEFQGDTGPYILYAYARINGIKKKAKEHGIFTSASIDTNLICDDSAYQLVKLIAEFDKAINRTIEFSEPSYLANYALELAKGIAKSYLDLRVIGEEAALATARLSLFEAARQTLGTAIELLGMRKLEQM
ncbi:MAG: arginine--tRNA ligase [Deltaproteobacteria bacterium]|nr:arginine--tRNA ligase [Deltaproteobacteria bacterium]